MSDPVNILIVDDQEYVVQGILSGVQWQQLPARCNVFSACNAEEARHIFSTQAVDIIVSDIEMPGESGIGLIHWVREHFPKTKCIFLTSHADFAYAQNAVRLHCVDYLLQPVKYDALLLVIEKAILLIKEQERDMNLIDQNTFWNLHSDELKKQIWHSFVLSQTPDIQDFTDKLSRLRITLRPGDHYAMLLMEEALVNNTLDELSENSELQELAEKFFNRLCRNQCQFNEHNRQFSQILVTDTSEEDLYDVIQTFLDLCQNNYEIYPVIYYGYAQSLDQIPDIYRQLNQLKSKHIAPRSRLLTLHETKKMQCPALPPIQHWSSYFIEHTTDLIVSASRDFIEKCIRTDSMNSLALWTLQQAFIHAFYTSLQMRSIQIRRIMERKEVFEAFSLSTQSVEGFFHFVDIIIETNNTIHENPTDKGPSLIEQAQTFINDNISGELSRKTVARSIHVSDSYLSHLFQKELGISLTDYISKQRMLLAKSMLSTTGMPVGFVAQKLGYNSVSYFIQAFRKEYGLTPTEYRKENP